MFSEVDLEQSQPGNINGRNYHDAFPKSPCLFLLLSGPPEMICKQVQARNLRKEAMGIRQAGIGQKLSV